MMVQLKKDSDFETMIGVHAAFTVIMQHCTGGVIVAIGQHRWLDKAAAGIVGFAIIEECSK